MLGPVGAKRDFSGLKDHGLSAQRDATVCHGVKVTLLRAKPVIKRFIAKNKGPTDADDAVKVNGKTIYQTQLT